MKKLENKVGVLTGASSGIGAVIAKSLSSEGVEIVGIARSEEGLQKTKIDIESHGGKFHSISFDIADLSNLSELKTKVENLVGEIDILINNAGIEEYNYFSNYTLDYFQKITSVNLVAPMEITRQFLPELQRNNGHIVNICSLAAKKGESFNATYSATKGGLALFSDALRQELHGTGIGVSALFPGLVSDVGMFSDSQVKAPLVLGTIPSKKVAKALVKAIKKNKPDVIVNSGPLRPLLAVDALFPNFGNWFARATGITAFCRNRAELGE
ncbi:MAG: SDR family NAD(P)-dependent oxidoreductase [Candidatus Marinimicrobia bacterium]|nr:SDR family NAD(P)-dependent oxidoreductase [Candidatus Neomarinimicrobiota bacterium]